MSAALIAERYAAALADVLTEPEALDRAQTRLSRFDFLCREYSDLYTALTNPAIVQQKREAVLKDLLDLLEMSGPVQRICLVLFRRHRFDLLHEVTEAFSRVVDERQGRMQAAVTSAEPMNDQQRDRLEAGLCDYCDHQLHTTYTVDPELIGGVLVRLDGIVLDGSLRAQLQRLRSTLLEEENGV